MKKITTPIPLSLYIHTPWCVRKCPYCDFNSHTLRNNLPEEIYAEALVKDLKNHLPQIQERPIHSIFIGGGTPSLLSPQFYESLFKKIRTHLTISNDIEITLEANPGTVEQSRFQDYRNLGINRISLGIQSFQVDQLKKLGRIHNSQEAIAAVNAAITAGFTNFNLDLMYGLPEQTIEKALSDLKTALDLPLKHLSWYQLTLEPNTYFYRFPPNLPKDDLIWEIQEKGQQIIQDHGLVHYEVSAYSQPNFYCQHNLNYWKFGDYLGIGAGAHSKITNLISGEINRHWNVRNPKDYLDPKKPFVENQKMVSSEELGLEFMMNALRLQNPIPIDLFSERTGLTMMDIESQLEEASEKNFLYIEDDCFKVTPQGKQFLNELLEVFLN